MAYGAPVQFAMELPQQSPSPYRPEGPATNELPEIKDATAETIRLEGTLIKRLPSMEGGALEDLYTSGTRQRAAAEYANDMRASWGISKSIDKRNRAVAKARARQNDRQIKNSGNAGITTRRKVQTNTKRREGSAFLRHARDYHGLGRDMYR